MVRRRLVIEEVDSGGFRHETQEIQMTPQGPGVSAVRDGVKEKPEDMLAEVKHFLGVK